MTSHMTSMSGRDWAILLILSVLWGGSFFVIEKAVETVRPLTFVLIPVSKAAAALWLFLLARRQRLPVPPGALLAFLLLALLNNVLPFVLFAWAQKEIAGGLASILNATTPIWGVIVAHLFTADERMTPAKVAGVLLGFGGVALWIGPDVLGRIAEQRQLFEPRDGPACDRQRRNLRGWWRGFPRLPKDGAAAIPGDPLSARPDASRPGGTFLRWPLRRKRTR